jgi:hypothetical protein
VIGVENNIVEMAIISTCLTFAAMHSVKGDVSLLAIREQIFREKEKIPLVKTTAIG